MINESVWENVRIHFTSGYSLLQLYDLEEILMRYEQQGAASEEGTMKQMLEMYNGGTFFRELQEIFPEITWIVRMAQSEAQLVQSIKKFFQDKMDLMGIDAVLSDIRYLYQRAD